MPVYEYQCLANHHQFDIFQPVGAAPPPCPICGSASRKVYRSVGLIFKGTGFHVTDYRRPASTGEGKPGGAAAESARVPQWSLLRSQMFSSISVSGCSVMLAVKPHGFTYAAGSVYVTSTCRCPIGAQKLVPPAWGTL